MRDNLGLDQVPELEGKTMTRRSYLRVFLISIMVFLISLPIWASAAEVGNITQVEQRVDYQKGQTGPVTPAMVKQPVEVNDVIQTYELSRAQVLFRDQTTITIAPKSKIAVEGYMFDPKKFERSGDFELIQGMVKIAVPVAAKVQKTTFTLKTSTAVMGVRGTEFLVTAGKNFTAVYPIKDEVCITSTSKQPGNYSVGGVAPGQVIGRGEVCLDPGTMSVILANQLPSSALPASPSVIAAAEALLDTGIDDSPGHCILTSLPGVDLVAVTKDLLSQGADLDSIRKSLALVSCDLPDVYAYTPGGPPIPAGLGPSFPGGGGGGGGTIVVVASPSS
jgi:FecR protein